MNEDFVSFSLAKKLKEKGFNQPCLAHYTNGKFEYIIAYFEEVELVDLYELWNNAGCFVDAPTISQVLKWLREEKKIHIEFVAAAYGYNYIVSDTPEKGGTDRHFSAIEYEGPNDGGAWDKYEQASIASIEYVIDNLI
jgi:hypothetical protein